MLPKQIQWEAADQGFHLKDSRRDGGIEAGRL